MKIENRSVKGAAKHTLKFCLLAGMALTLAACGGAKIDATNADTLQESVLKLGKKMTEEERKEFATNLKVVADAAAVEEDELLRRVTPYPNVDYSDYFATGEEKERSKSRIFSPLASKAPKALDNKTPKTLAKSAEDVRKSYFAAWAESNEKDIEELKASLDLYDKRISKIGEELTELDALIEKKAKAVSESVSNVKITSIQRGSSYSPTVIMEGTADVKNFASLPITQIYGEIKADFKNSDTFYFHNKSEDLKFEVPIGVGETRTGIPFKWYSTIRSSVFAKSNESKSFSFDDLFGGADALTNINFIANRALMENRRSERFGADQSTTRQREQLVKERDEACPAAKKSTVDYIEARKEFTKVLKERAKKPSNDELDRPSRESSFSAGYCQVKKI